MRAHGVFLLLAVTVFGIPAAADELVVNGSFESALTGWTKSGSYTSVQCSGSPPDGSCFFEAGTVSGLGSLGQTLNTVVGEEYTLSFYLANGRSSPPDNLFQIYWGGGIVSAATLEDANSFGFQKLTFANLAASSTSTTLEFLFQHAADFWSLDKVSVASKSQYETYLPSNVPEPGSLILIGSGLSGIVVRRLRKQRQKRSSA